MESLLKCPLSNFVTERIHLYMLEPRCGVLRHYLENHGNVAESVRKSPNVNQQKCRISRCTQDESLFVANLGPVRILNIEPSWGVLRHYLEMSQKVCENCLRILEEEKHPNLRMTTSKNVACKPLRSRRVTVCCGFRSSSYLNIFLIK